MVERNDFGFSKEEQLRIRADALGGSIDDLIPVDEQPKEVPPEIEDLLEADIAGVMEERGVSRGEALLILGEKMMIKFQRSKHGKNI